jgi:hypothetical protein
VRGLNEALEYVDKEGVTPLLLIAATLKDDGLKTVILDCSPIADAEEIRLGVMNAVMLSVAAKLRS